MKLFQISTPSGLTLQLRATTKENALDQLARLAGYSSHRVAPAAELFIVEVR